MSVTHILSLTRPHTSRLLAAALIVVALIVVHPVGASPDNRAALARHFSFTRATLAEPLGQHQPQTSRVVNGGLRGISNWISAVGAAVALYDLDANGRPDDVCSVDPRTNTVLVAPAPGTSPRYPGFVLDVDPLPYDPQTMAPMGCLPGDFDEDGSADVLVYYWGRTPVLFVRNADIPLSRAAYTPVELLADGQRWFTNSALQADVDGDGHPDLVIGNYFADGARILDSSTAADAEMQMSMSRATNGAGPHFLLWQRAPASDHPSVLYVEADPGLSSSVVHGWTLAMAAADLSGDLLPDIYVANDFGPDHLLHNLSTPGHLRFVLLEGARTLSTPASKVLGHDSFKGMGVDFGDLRGQGLLDMFVSNITEPYALEESNLVFSNTGRTDMLDGRAPFVEESDALGLARSGWAWDAKMADFDNSGTLQIVQATGFVKGAVNRWPELQELAMGNPELLRLPGFWPLFQDGTDLSGTDHNPFFVRNDDGRFVDVAPELGLAEPGVSRGIAIADVDGTGLPDFAVANQWAPSSFYRNTCRDCGAFVGLHLLVPVGSARVPTTLERPGLPGPDLPGRPAIGATALAFLPDGSRRLATVDGGNGHSGKNSPDIHFGLGHVRSDVSIAIELRWRDPGGLQHREQRNFSPGWHTVLLSDAQ